MAVEAIDRATWLAMRRLVESGMITLADGQPRVLYRSPHFGTEDVAGGPAAAAPLQAA
jgi:hypothetical protein